MTGRIKLSFSSPVNEEPDRNLIIGSLEQRKEAFKEDEELMKETEKFVTEVIETAASEASKRKFEKQNASESEGVNNDIKHPRVENFNSGILENWNPNTFSRSPKETCVLILFFKEKSETSLLACS
ncbi:uncharacterized protein LOC117178296 isoform X1 [Belonocnema kinseyi]|uniref:uncharacterized protein LOC117178296 isoform X1 n=1 Tax=Belonocnema kinseyi TaxID=2817044 RepID=UPI00143CDCAF|nr:uncharacterized protein LOC117178296 isoform X1 [Belonocnema kinseyi]